MKGVSAVVSVILLLLISIAMVGMAFVWFSRTTQDIEGSVENQLTHQDIAMRTKAKIDNINKAGNQVMIRNTGTVAIKPSQILIYVDETTMLNYTRCGIPSADIQPNAVVVCTNAAIGTCTDNIKLTTIGMPDIVAC